MDLHFTVITVVYNAEKKLDKTISSVLEQEYPPYEYLIVDGRSTDGTVKAAQAYSAAFRQRGIHYRILSESDNGIYNAMNKGIRAAAGDWISFLNAGDWYEPDALKNIRAFYKEAPFDLTYGGLHYVRPNGTVRNKMSKLDSFPVSSRNWNHPSMFLRRELYLKYGFDERFRVYADFDLYLRLRRDRVSIRVIDRVIATFAADGQSTDPALRNALIRAGEKYRSYAQNGYSRFYWLESYGWELFKSLYFLVYKRT